MVNVSVCDSALDGDVSVAPSVCSLVFCPGSSAVKSSTSVGLLVEGPGIELAAEKLEITESFVSKAMNRSVFNTRIRFQPTRLL